MSAQHTPSAWVESNGHGGFAVWQSVGAAKQHIATFKLESAALEYAAITDWRTEREDLIELLTDIGRWLDCALAQGQINRGTANRDGDLVTQIRAVLAKAKGGAR